MDALDHQSELEQLLKRFSHRLRWRDGISLVQRTAWAPILAALLIHLIGRLLPVQNLIVWMLIPLPVWLLGLLSFSLLRPMPHLAIARRLDHELGLRERLGTAYLLEAAFAGKSKQSTPQPQFPAELVKLQRQDALFKAHDINPRHDLPFIWQKRPLLVSAGLALCLALLVFLPNPMDEVIAQRAAIAQAAEEQADAIDQLREEIAESDQLSPELQEQLLRRLAELAEQLRNNPGDLAEALADLSRVEEALRAQLDPQAALRQATLEALAAQLQTLAQTESRPAADTSATTEALNQLAEMMAQMDQAQREELAQTLAQMAARASQTGDSSLAQALASLAGAAQTGDSQAASQAASQAGQAFSRAQSQFSDQASLQQTLSRLQDSRQALGQAGQGRSVAQASGQGQGSGEGDGNGDGDGEGDGSGQGQGQGQGQPGGGGGTTADTLPPATSSGAAGRPQGDGQAGSVTDVGEQVYAPWERRPNSGEQVFIPGQDTDQGDTQVRERTDPLPGAANPALMPYYDVYYTYIEAANQVIEQSYIPSGLKDYVREYFSNLEP
ncbi:MAG: hypothetical protein R6V73_07135 [Anaerolineales bacterium]|jgi:hypothetical protein